jgi:hypothetical protein
MTQRCGGVRCHSSLMISDQRWFAERRKEVSDCP